MRYKVRAGNRLLMEKLLRAIVLMEVRIGTKG
jgi:hypothetical protein